MRPDDETPEDAGPPDPPEDEQPPADDPAGEHEDAPATWAGRRHADESKDEPDQQDEPDEPANEGTEDEEELRAGFTDEFDAIERELDEELRALEGEDDEEEKEADEAEVEADQAEAEEDDGAAAGPETIEAETLALADREQAEEAALAGLQARTAQHGVTPPPAAAAGEEPSAAAEQPPDAEPAAAAGADDRSEPPPRSGLWARFLAASLLIVVSMAAATSIALLNELTDFAKGLGDNDALASLRDQLEEVEGGDPQTILIIGSDKRLDTTGDPGRSDTTILLRVDPEKDAIALLSIPRDLEVTIPGVGRDKFNAAYSAGGEKKTLEVVKRLTGLEINHVVNINFTGFADAVDAIGCVYVDVDRRYYIAPGGGHLGDRHRGRLPAAVRLQGAPVRALPPRGQRPRPLRPPAGLPPRGAPEADRRQAGRRRRGPARDLHRVHDLRHLRRGDAARAAQVLPQGPGGAGERGPFPGRARRRHDRVRDRVGRGDRAGGGGVPRDRGHPRGAPGRGLRGAGRGPDPRRAVRRRR